MQPVLSVAEMNAVDAAALDATTLEELVARAGTAVALAALDLMGGAYGRRVVVVVGPGNNGADGRVAAQVLERRGARITVIEAGTTSVIRPADLVIDAAFGTGFRGEFRFPPVPLGTPVLAVDIPSGVRGDTGEASGAPVAADRTVTFVALKPGLLQGDGVRLAGRVAVADIGLPAGTPRVAVVDDGDLAALVPERARRGNKWSAAVLVVAGSPGMTGAAALCARAAYRAGAGMVRLGVPGLDLADSPASEAVSVSLPAEEWAAAALDAAARCSAVVVGPGLGRAPGTAAEVARLVADSPVPVVVDADGLHALGKVGSDESFRARSRVVLTPHDGEYARLAGGDPGPDRIAAARSLAAASGAVALLKGPTTAVAQPDGRVRLAMAGTTALATAGTGDVLSGVIGALVARGTDPLEAAALAAHLHGRAGALAHGEGTVAGDLPDLVATVLADLRDSGVRTGDPRDRNRDRNRDRRRGSRG
jgi:ADP-dependent NAD(P)H-hydrate dehydratase / NAD(P)H-hydrate epimerase